MGEQSRAASHYISNPPPRKIVGQTLTAWLEATEAHHFRGLLYPLLQPLEGTAHRSLLDADSIVVSGEGKGKDTRRDDISYAMEERKGEEIGDRLSMFLKREQR
ncbi:hypothetical protein SISSUDRAFT_732957 [Sistotremastrum suecicum HHB10207 ss-3]|uniref:Uncharacterized protein n=1 Tax=Sistotremastrum suecicum HHB10207 ss-3 TaxID=1314776 RepID=A0A166DF72_9AGAM|nr:hypothetical protein SISSUDRAFT_732957 [Sistotremastrum suecicum HHB10207 ss-3]